MIQGDPRGSIGWEVKSPTSTPRVSCGNHSPWYGATQIWERTPKNRTFLDLAINNRSCRPWSCPSAATSNACPAVSGWCFPVSSGSFTQKLGAKIASFEESIVGKQPHTYEGFHNLCTPNGSKWLVHNGKTIFQNGWFGGTHILGNPHLFKKNDATLCGKSEEEPLWEASQLVG